jgi:hypothetical protein
MGITTVADNLYRKTTIINPHSGMIIHDSEVDPKEELPNAIRGTYQTRAEQPSMDDLVAQKVEEGLARAMPNMIDSIVSKLAEKLK